MYFHEYISSFEKGNTQLTYLRDMRSNNQILRASGRTTYHTTNRTRLNTPNRTSNRRGDSYKCAFKALKSGSVLTVSDEQFSLYFKCKSTADQLPPNVFTMFRTEEVLCNEEQYLLPNANKELCLQPVRNNLINKDSTPRVVLSSFEAPKLRTHLKLLISNLPNLPCTNKLNYNTKLKIDSYTYNDVSYDIWFGGIYIVHRSIFNKDKTVVLKTLSNIIFDTRFISVR